MLISRDPQNCLFHICCFSDPPVSTKSCDDLHRVNVNCQPVASRSEGCLLTTLLLTPSLFLTPRTTNSPHSGSTTKYRVWKGFSRSARDVSAFAQPSGPRPAVSVAVMEKLTPRAARPVSQKASTLPYSAASGPQPVGGRRHRGFGALLRRISPRLKRTPSPDQPWTKVEPHHADRTSVASDHSYETAMQIRRRQDLIHNDGSQGGVNSKRTTPLEPGTKSEIGRTGKGGLSGFLTSLIPGRTSKEKKASSNHSNEKAAERNADVGNITENEIQEQHEQKLNANEQRHNGSANAQHKLVTKVRPFFSVVLQNLKSDSNETVTR